MKTLNLTVLLFSLAILSLTATAQIEGNPENWCRNGLFPRDNSDFRIAKVIGGNSEKIFFYGDEKKECPGGKGCRLNSYVVPGNEVIVSRQYGDFVCAWYQPKSGAETVSWVKASNVMYVSPKTNLSMQDFVGNWTFYDNTIEIKKAKTGSLLSVSGEAFWRGLGDNIHIGAIEGDVPVAGNTIKIGEDDKSEHACRATLRLVGRYLIVSDNLNCGGMNVTFTGVYRR